MNFSLAAKGHSFKGAFTYYLHDKGAQTAERVAWTATRNLAHDDPAYAQSVMIATARQADALKKAAGVKASGRKAGGPVHAYSISWHPENETVPDQAGMLAIADETLKLLKADHLQAVIICHRDTAHPHVHVVVNRVDPNTGKMHPFGNDVHKLDEWAAKYERERGQIVSPNRDAKHEERKRQRAAPVSAKAAFAPKASPPATAAKSRAAELAERQAAQKAQHKQEWVDLAAANKARREVIYADRPDFKAIAAQHRAETRPLWSQLGKDQAAERRAFKAREKRIGGIVRNAIDIVRGQQIRGQDEDRGFLSMCFNYVVSAPLRQAAFAARQQEVKDELAQRIEAGLLAKFDVAKAARGEKLAEASRIYTAARATLIEDQDKKREALRAEWRQLYAEGQYKPRPSWQRRSAGRGDHQAPETARSQARPVKARVGAFKDAAQLAPANQSQPATDRADKWRKVEELGEKSRQQGQGMNPARYRGRELRRE